MSIEVKIIVDGIEYEFIPKQAAGGITEDSQSRAATSTPESTNSLSTQTTPEVVK